MARGQGNQPVLIDDGLDAQAIVAAVNGPHECDIDRVTADRRDQAGCCPFFKRECDVWIAATELADDLRDQWMERRGIDHADADAAEFATGDPARVLAGLLDVAQAAPRSDERRVGTEGVSQCRSRWTRFQ